MQERRGWIRWATGALLLALSLPAIPAAAAATEAVVVQGQNTEAAAAAVTAAGGTVTRTLDLVHGVAAKLSPASAATLDADPALAVTPDRTLHVTGSDFTPSADAPQFASLHTGPDWDPTAGDGVGVALVDTGVTDATGAFGDRLVEGADFSGEGDGIDRYGHGTFMAGLIAGGGGLGVAPGATVVSVKVAGADGSTSLSQVLAGLGWVVDNAEDYDIRVLSLSFGVDAPMPWRADPLSNAVEAAWASGLAVVVSAGNDGAGDVTSPGRDPWVITVGATDTRGTATTKDDTVPDFSGTGRVAKVQKPEVVAPGVDVVSLRAPGSYLDRTYPVARMGRNYFRGTGTSMSTALTAGGAAVLLWGHPEATPDDVKGALVDGADRISKGQRAVNIGAALAEKPDDDWVQKLPSADGSDTEWGPSDHMPWNGTRWSGTRWSGTRWSGTRWSGTRWSATRWSGTRWSGTRWSGTRWSGTRWSATRWSAMEFA
ncbi:MAG TPA: S8 family serine peptidase [Acidimicrobiales bacterium]|nr:S8 family serine peptidase [Acidimicrobiales bacterium]